MMANIGHNLQPVPQVLIPKLSKIQLTHELGIMYVIVDGQTKLAMNTEQFIEFFQFAIKKAYAAQAELNRAQQQKGDPTVHIKSGESNLARALMRRASEQIDLDELAAKVAEKMQRH